MHYRFYELNAAGRIANGGDILAESDEEAIRVARDTVSAEAFEIWCRTRRVFPEADEPAQ